MKNLLKNIINTVSFGRFFATTTDGSDGSMLSLNGDGSESNHLLSAAIFPQTLNLGALRTEMTRVANKDLPRLALGYREEDGLEPVIDKAIGKFEDEWTAWEKGHCSDLAEAKALLHEEKATYSKDEIETGFFQNMKELGVNLKESLKNAYRLRASNKAQAKELHARRIELEDNLRTMRIAFTGDENKSIGSKNSKWTTLVIVLMILVIGAIENILGFGTFKYESDTLTAYALSTVVVAVFSVMAYFGGNGASQLLATWEAHRRFRSTYSTERSIPKDRFENPIKPHPSSILAWTQFILGTGLFAIASAILLVGRLGIIEKMSNDDSSMYLAGAIALIFVNFILYVVKVLYGAKYNSSDVNSYETMETELADVMAEREIVKPGAHLDIIDDALNTYQSEIDAAKLAAQSKVEWLKGLLASYIELADKYDKGWAITQQFFHTGINQLWKALHNQQGIDNGILRTALDDPKRPLINRLNDEVTRKFEDDVFLGQAKGWFPEMPELDDRGKINDISQILKDAEAEVEAEVESNLLNNPDANSHIGIQNWEAPRP